jgi:hypothetical protein
VRPYGVTWTSPDGHLWAHRGTIGYPTRAEAEAVGQQFLSKHGEAYQVHGS